MNTLPTHFKYRIFFCVVEEDKVKTRGANGIYTVRRALEVTYHGTVAWSVLDMSTASSKLLTFITYITSSHKNSMQWS